MVIKSIGCILGVVWVIAAFNAGCAVKPAKFDPQTVVTADSATVVIYRPDSLTNALVEPGVLVDGEFKFNIGNKQCRVLQVSLGSHQMSLLLEGRYQGQHDVVLETEINKVYFLRIDTAVKFRLNQPYERRFDLLRVSEEEARAQFASCATRAAPVEAVPQTAPVRTDNYSNEKFRNPFNH